MSERTEQPLAVWPRGMPIELAARYCGISPGTLRSVGPAPVRISRARLVYLKDHLDRWLDRLAGNVPISAEGDKWAG